ncbi:MAG TPA: hypothetical protein VNK41_10540 [Vicinamibacterales bacterium]|nr:hypothetical protein [Vicinamibacterales bacterium]
MPTTRAAIVVLVVLLPRFAALYAINLFDDAFITFRHAENLAAGEGLVFNPGDRVLGTTTPLFALMLAAADWVGIPVPTAALALGLAADAVIGLLVYRVLAKELTPVDPELTGVAQGRPGVAQGIGPARSVNLAALGAVTVFAVDPQILRVSAGGMESSLFVAGSLVIMHLLLEGRAAAALSLAAAVCFIRPEGMLLLGAAGFALLRSPLSWNRKAQSAALAGLILGGPALLIWRYYGSLLPHSVVAKATMHSDLGDVLTIFFWPSASPLQGVLTIAAPIALALLWRRSRFIRAFAIWSAVYAAAYAWRQPPMWTWYGQPIYVLKAVLAGAAVGFLIERHAPRLVPGGVMRYAGALAVSAGAALLLVAIGGTSHVRESVYDPMQRWCESRVTSSDRIVAADIGAVGYYCDAYVIDLSGLVWPDRYGRHQFHSPREIVEIEEPEFILADVTRHWTWLFDPDAPVRRQYRPAVRFSRRGLTDLDVPISELSPDWQQDYIVFERTDLVGRQAPR